MNIIEHLEHTVSTAVLGTAENVSHISLLEQFYALIISKLAIPQAYSQFLRHQTDTPNPAAPLFEQIWPSKVQRALIIDELMTTHHTNEATTEQLLINAAPLTYQALKDAANGQFLPAYLQSIAPTVRAYLPVWAETVLTDGAKPPIDTVPNVQAPTVPTPIEASSVPVIIEEDVIDADAEVNTNDIAKNTETHSTKTDSDVISASPADYRTETSSQARYQAEQQTRTRNRRQDLLIRLGLLTALIAALALLWAFVINPTQTPPTEPVVATDPVVAPPETVPALTPMALVVAVDDNGNLYTCTASVGDTDVQAALEQALKLNFGDQANICELSVTEGVATQLPLSQQALSDTFGRLRTVPFARLQLQNDSITLEAPDDEQLERLRTDIQTLAPTLSIMATAPLPLPQSEVIDSRQSTEAAINEDDAPNPNANSNENVLDSQSNVNNQRNPVTDAVPAPAPPPPENFTNQSSNRSLNRSNPNAPVSNPPNGLSMSEVDDLANSTIVAEELRGARPVDENIQNQ